MELEKTTSCPDSMTGNSQPLGLKVKTRASLGLDNIKHLNSGKDYIKIHGTQTRAYKILSLYSPIAVGHRNSTDISKS